jgi:hypothetical protein
MRARKIIIISTAASAAAALAAGIGACGGSASPDSHSGSASYQVPAAAKSWDDAQGQAAPDPVAILSKIKGIHLRAGEIAGTNVQGTPYAEGMLGHLGLAADNGNIVTVWTGPSPAAIKVVQGGTGF